MVGNTIVDQEKLSSMWKFIMHASHSYDLYGRGQSRALVDRTSLAIVYYYRMDNDLVIV